MNRNVESHFAVNPTDIEMPRSKFNRPSRLLTTFNAGQLIPLYCDEVLPGDTFQMDTSMVIRMSTPIFPVMDNCYFDYYYFFVPNRLVWEHWKEFNGENNSGPWVQTTEYEVPQIFPPVDGWSKGSLADYFGVPTNVGQNGDLEEWSISALPFRAYTLIWNEWFRDQNTMSPAYFYNGDNSVEGLNPSSEDFKFGTVVNYNSALYGGTPLPVSKYHDYFTSALPQPQKGEDSLIPFTGFTDGRSEFTAPVTTSLNNNDMSVLSSVPLRFINGNGEPVLTAPPEEAPFSAFYHDLIVYSDNRNSQFDSQLGYTTTMGDNNNSGVSGNIYPSNLVAVLNNELAVTINQLRSAFQIQRLLEKDARGGTRYIEILKSHFGVTSPDGRLQRPEYLGGKRVPINVDQVLQTSSTDDVSPQGNTAAYSLTTHVDSDFTQSFTEHGYVICVGAVRTDHTYQQGLERSWFRKRRFDYYWPALAHLGEQPIYRGELMFTGRPETDTGTAFGYQEAWAEYRYKPSRVSGAFRSNYAQSLDSWHYADYFGDETSSGVLENNNFVVNSDFISETSANIERTLAVASSVEDQFIADFYFKNECTRVMPMYSIPGLIDHY